MSVANIRKSYEAGSLNEEDVQADPIVQFREWLDTALKSDMREPTAVVLATADAQGQPSARLVLLKGVRDDGFVFYSNYQSRKAQDLAANPQAALTFYWDALERQVRIEGNIEKVARETSLEYFKSRPHGSQIGALASPQSQVIAGRDVLQEKVATLKERYDEGEVPLPEHWGGYLLKPEKIEFWQGRPSRLHDRLRYRLEDGNWIVERLAP